MAAMASARLSGLPPTAYYAPNYRVEVEGRELSPETKGDVLELKVVMDMENMSSFEMTISNWDDKRFQLKYSDTTTFDVGNRVHVQMGYADRLRSMIRGQISSLAPKFPESGSPTIAVSGLDGMLRLRDRKPAEGETKKYVQMADWEIAQAVASRNQLKVRVTQEGPKHDLVVQKNQDDAQFLMERAKRIDFDCYVQTDADSGEDTLVFMKPTDARDSRGANVYVFEWGKTLGSFEPQLKLSRQVSQVTVRGWNSRTKEAISSTATASDLPGASGGGTSGPDAARRTLADKQEVVVDAPVTSSEEARDLARSLLRERAYEFITGSARVIGLSDLRPGDNVELQRVGQRFSGTYYVTKVEHTLGSGGYLTSFDVRRVFDGGTR
jgi:phage protein D